MKDVAPNAVDSETTDSRRSLSSEWFCRVYDLLVSFGGASESNRGDFIFHHTHQDPCDEYRFVGHFGCGGKYLRKDNRVTFYPEDESPGRNALLVLLNAELGKL